MRYEVILPSAVRSSTGSSPTIVLPADADLRADLVVSASSAPTTLDAVVEHSNDGGATWVPLGSFTQVGAVATATRTLSISRPTSGLLRASWTAVGTSYTFSISIRGAY
jgi:hypothetical protein